MLATTARLLELLELLQARPVATGAEIAGRLAVDRRTVRRYIAALQELGIPVEGERGVGGGYRLRPGYRLPPLMLTDGEAVAAVLGLAAARRLGLDGAAQAADQALAKIYRVLPAALRQRVEALEAALGCTAPVTPPAGFNAAAQGRQSLAGGPRPWPVEVLLRAPLQQVARQLPAALAELAEDRDGTLLRMRVDSLDWMARILAGLGCDFIIREPGELRASVRALADWLTRLS